ncbi:MULTISPECIES: L-serine ammonia-lyase, iron-sulfur-dependent subunit beta [unclassified Butyrivibrio]|uniref:L-serine ammonia-lyase, iron-sulfur-dependent subunit beta n=1 Tax=unclassified Butyrivibrio TaxID=2639466 RepID=UPI0003B67896|nr:MULTISPECIES: L-serine ammonia-lyase, iron-sulfur-dependent subunit beta [unclassified Butyrivibrio]MDC7294457.1 L-serine ammonia-lyase, iron-sulfur-dependent subunit beta [Butyrivibrio sp. DSM 10294]
MNVFDIIGPVMIGPSSSHTAGAVRLGRVVNKIMNEQKPESVEVTLSGSFAQTYKGHGTDRALMAGIMGFDSDSEEIRDALEIARDRGIKYSFIKKNIPGAHPNTALINYTLPGGETGTVLGCSIGGGNIRVDSINGMKVEFSGEKNTLLIMHKDKPGVIAKVTNFMHFFYSSLNICNFRLSREEKGGNAIMTIEIDGVPPEHLIEDIKLLRSVDNAILIRRI